MPQIINTNLASLNAQRNLNSSQSALGISLQRLSSGLRINSAKDDAAGLAISERMTTQIRGINQATRNANDGVSLGQVAEGALGAVGDALQRIRELAVQSANATNSSSDRAALNAEVTQLVGEITRIGDNAAFNGLKILDGTYTNQQFQIGANSGQTLSISLGDSRAVKLGATTLTSTSGFDSTALLDTGITLNGTAIATTGLTTIAQVINKINESSSATSVTASRANTNSVDTGTFTAADATITVNGVAIALTAAAQTNVATAAARINQFTTQTGVTADGTGATLVLSNTSGADITILDDTDGTNADVFGNAAITSTAPGGTFVAGIELSTPLGSTITAAGTLATTLNLTTAVAVDYKLSATSVDTVTNANNAIKAVDFALNQVNKNRADLGAIQRRFESIIVDLSANAENLNASRSRIRDADFAAETAELTRTQILQQAGIAILSQANSVPKDVLTLLR